MSPIKLNSTFCILIAILSKVGIWKIREESKYREMGRKFFYIFSYIFFQMLVSMFAYLSDDRNQSLFLMEMVVGCMILNAKLIYLLWKKNEILEFLHDSLISNSMLDRIQARKMQIFVKFVLVYNLVIIATGIFLNITCLPFISNEKKLPLFIAMDWRHGIVVYCVTFIILAWGVIFSCFSNLCTSFIWYIMLNYSIKYQILENEFRNLGAVRTVQELTSVGKMCKDQNQNVFLLDFIGLVNQHRNLSKKIDEFTSLCHTLFWVQLIISGVFISTSTYLLAFTRSFENVFETTTYIVGLSYGISDIFLVMYLANEIRLASHRLSYCLFASNWIEQSTSNRKLVIILSEFLKRPQEMVIFELYPMNLETFTLIMRTAYKMFNILKTFNTKN